MPRRLLLNGHIVDDEWSHDAAEEAGAGIGLGPLIVTLERWRTARGELLARAGRLGVVLKPADKVEELAPDIAHFELIAAEFSGPSEGRGYTQGRLLRERHHFSGELRATGYVRRDQVFFLARCGFNSFELPESDLTDAQSALATFTAAYQPSNDEGLPKPLPLAVTDDRVLKRPSGTPASA